MASQPLAQRDFSGGVNMVSNPYLLQPKQCLAIRNMLLDEHGSLSTRDGFLTVATNTGIDTTNPIVYRGMLNQVNGASFPFAFQYNPTTTTMTPYRTDTTPWTVIAAGYVPAFLIPSSVTVTDLEVFVTGTAAPFTWNGAVAAPITALAGETLPPGGNYIAFHLGSVWLWNTNATTTTLDGPSSLRMSDATNPLGSWPSASQAFIAKDDGQVGMGLSSYTIAETGISPTATLVAFKNYSAYQINGVFASPNFSIQRIKSDMGCIAPRTIQFVAGFGIIRLTHKGFSLYNGVDDKLISEEIRPAIFGDAGGSLSHASGLQSLNFQSIIRSYAVQIQNPPLYVAACPVAGTGLSRVFIYDLVRKAWTIADYPRDLQCLSLITTLSTQPQVQAGMASGGSIVRLFAGDATDDGAPVQWLFTLRPMSPSNLATENAYFRRATLDLLYAPTQTVTVNATPAGLATFSRPATFTAVAGGSVWGNVSSIWGQSVWGAGTSVESRVSVDLMRTAPSMSLTCVGTGPVRVRAVTIQATPKPPTKAKG